MTNINNLGGPQIANKAFVPLAIEAGIETTLTSLIPLAITERELVIRVVEALEVSNPELAAAWNIQTQKSVLDFLALKQKTAFCEVSDLPVTVNEPGPVSVDAARDETITTQVNVTFSEQPTGYKYGLYLDGLFQGVGVNGPVEGFTSDIISDVPPGEHTVRVLFVTPELALTLFGPVANVAS